MPGNSQNNSWVGAFACPASLRVLVEADLYVEVMLTCAGAGWSNSGTASLSGQGGWDTADLLPKF